MARRTVLITGGTDGIGLALARLYASAGERTIVVGRRSAEEVLERLPPRVLYCQADLARPDAPEVVEAFLVEHDIEHLDILLHNAGTGWFGRPEEQSASSIDEVIDVNLWTPIALTHELLPHLSAAKGKLVFVTSMVTELPSPEFTVYAATKAGLEGFARSLRIELQGEVSVHVVRPGATRTGLHAKVGLTSEAARRRVFAPADEVAQGIARAVDRGLPWATIGMVNRLVSCLGRYGEDVLDPLLRFGRRPWGRSRREPRKIVVTGAADGIGRALAHQYVSMGRVVFGIDVDADKGARTRAALNKLPGHFEFLRADLAARETYPTIAGWLEEKGPFDIVIHNAGINDVGPFRDADLATQRRLLEVNLRAPLHLSADLLANETISAHGSLVYLSSLSRYVSYPGAAVYAATKDALAAYARGLSITAAERDIAVLTVFPGPTRTEHARRHSPDNRTEGKRMAPDELAKSIVTAISARRSHLVPGLGNAAIAWLGHCFPSLPERIMKRAIWEKVRESDPTGRS
ncbi:3-oxoacyl-[acyl-carrier-protein] reductase FabG [Planctomycetes bacterium Pan216]|uniref:3-oxoacyl-[acyl-carrier-protein] reductase FabG n=1 Tax=Kolteria novifilia TaxID=2527975 RepID=A0A518B9R7_9BACT|nr:3-oxoacyl-[acyl-carrier-protein] reductase FabG [Planctomycetes bacterium Pan216]